jgi:hypothetical protein
VLVSDLEFMFVKLMVRMLNVRPSPVNPKQRSAMVLTTTAMAKSMRISHGHAAQHVAAAQSIAATGVGSIAMPHNHNQNAATTETMIVMVSSMTLGHKRDTLVP